MTDRELAPIGALAMKEFAAWKARNKAREELRNFLRDYQCGTDEPFVREYADTEDIAKFDALNPPAIAAQKKLNAARAATRRAIVRAEAELGKSI